jgi:hypothetical protein
MVSQEGSCDEVSSVRHGYINAIIIYSTATDQNKINDITLIGPTAPIFIEENSLIAFTGNIYRGTIKQGPPYCASILVILLKLSVRTDNTEMQKIKLIYRYK